MRFKESEIDAAMRMRAAGLPWGPEPGQYIFDINGMVRAGSPFQAGVYLIHSANTFEAMAGGPEELFENFVWLPTWEEALAWLREMGVGNDKILEIWQDGLANGCTDKESLYSLMLEILEDRARGN
ncbi:MAG: hypothetical protein ACE5HV_09060 [Acidobacteriota bacterium]